jgi:hypothetical protein
MPHYYYSDINCTVGEKMNTYKVMVGKSEEKRLLGRPRCRLDDNIKMDLRDVG